MQAKQPNTAEAPAEEDDSSPRNQDPGMVALQGRGEAASEAARFEAQKERKLALQAHITLFNRCGCV